MGVLRLILGLAAALVVVTFGVKNMGPVPVAYLEEGRLILPLFYVMLACFAGGFIIAWLGGFLGRIRSYRLLRLSRRRVRHLEKEVEQVRREGANRLLAAPSANPPDVLPEKKAAPFAAGSAESPEARWEKERDASAL